MWSVRKYKTRSIATEEIRKERVRVNEDLVKPSREIKTGDEIMYRKDGIEYSLKVIDLPKSRVGAKLVENYIIETTSEEELNKKEFIQLMRNMGRKKGTGRPTKKDRRNLDDFQT